MRLIRVISKSAFLLSFCLPLTGSVGVLGIKVSGTDQPIFSIYAPMSWAKPCVAGLSVTYGLGGKGSFSHVMWNEYSTAKGICLSSKPAEYGTATPGFITAVAPKTLDDGKVYRVEADALGRFGFVYFRRIRGVYTKIDPPFD